MNIYTRDTARKREKEREREKNRGINGQVENTKEIYLQKVLDL